MPIVENIPENANLPPGLAQEDLGRCLTFRSHHGGQENERVFSETDIEVHPGIDEQGNVPSLPVLNSAHAQDFSVSAFVTLNTTNSVPHIPSNSTPTSPSDDRGVYVCPQAEEDPLARNDPPNSDQTLSEHQSVTNPSFSTQVQTHRSSEVIAAGGREEKQYSVTEASNRAPPRRGNHSISRPQPPRQDKNNTYLSRRPKLMEPEKEKE